MTSIDRPRDRSLPAGRLAGAGDFEISVAPHLIVLKAIAGRLVGDDDAGDVVQEALLRAWRRRSTFDPARGSVRAWLAAIVVDRARAHRRGHRHDGAIAPIQLVDEPSREADPTQRLVIERAVASLPRRQREVIALYYLADLSVEETARALHIRPGSVKAHLAAARAKLRVQLEQP